MNPDWWQRGVVYQLYMRSFADSDGDGVGDLPGVIAHLDHLNDGTPASLGVDAILLSPMYPSPGFDVGYDISDYRAVDPMFGTMDDFTRLVDDAHGRGIAIVLDLVMNHTSHLHPWFVASRASRTGPYADWYLWRDPSERSWRGRGNPNNWVSYFGGTAWTWEPARDQFYLHTFLPQQPDLNWRNPDVRAAMLEMVRFWLDRGVDGFRLDVFNVFFKDRDLRSNPRRRSGGIRGWDRQRHLNDKDQPELHGFLAEFRTLLESVPRRMSVGELFSGDPAGAARYTAPRHLVFDFRLSDQPWRADALAAAIDEREAAFGPAQWPTVVLSNHDQPRQATRFSRGRERDSVAKAAAVLLLTLRGTPFLYYGEEIGLGDVRLPRREIVDPPARHYWPLPMWWNRDACRAPLPWTAHRPARTWMRMAPDTATRNVERQAATDDSVLALYRRLIWLRKASPALQAGQFAWEVRARSGVLAYWRRTPDERVLVAINTRSTPASVALPDAGNWQVLLSTSPAPTGPITAAALPLGPYQAAILR
ncbi:MAG: alpha-glucosidase [Chloroflexota bacterium]